MTIDVSIAHFVIKVQKLVQIMIGTIQSTGLSSTHFQSKMPAKNPRWPPQIQDDRHDFQFFDISTSDDGDFPNIIDVALLCSFSFSMPQQHRVFFKTISHLFLGSFEVQIERGRGCQIIRPSAVEFVFHELQVLKWTN